MNKLTLRDRIILFACALAFGIYAFVHIAYTPINQTIAAVNQQKLELKTALVNKSPQEQQLKQLNQDNEDLVKQISEFKNSQTAKTLTKEEFLLFLSDTAQKNGAEVIRFNDLDAVTEKGVWKTTFDFQLRGTLKNLNAVCSSIDLTGIRYSVGSMSLRQNEEYPYLTRSFDDSSHLGWYKDPFKQEETTESTPVQEAPDVTQPEQVNPSADLSSQTLPTISPQPTQPPELEKTPEPKPLPTPDTDNGNINDRLNDLLGVSTWRTDFKLVFLKGYSNGNLSLLTNLNEESNVSDGEVLTLSLTIQFIMYQEPLPGSSIVINDGGQV